MLPWQFFANALSESSASLIGNANLISKVYFPRLIIPATAIITSLVDFAISAVVLALLMVWYGYWPDWRIATVPLFILMALGAAVRRRPLATALNVNTAISATWSRSSCSSASTSPRRLQQLDRARALALLYSVNPWSA
jgi:hypothetical protein